MGVCYPGGSRRGGGYPGVAPVAAASVPFQNVGSTEQVFVFSRALRAPVCVPECWIDCVPALPHLRVPIRECSDGTWIALVSVSRVVSNTGTFRKRLLSGDTSRHGD